MSENVRIIIYIYENVKVRYMFGRYFRVSRKGVASGVSEQRRVLLCAVVLLGCPRAAAVHVPFQPLTHPPTHHRKQRSAMQCNATQRSVSAKQGLFGLVLVYDILSLVD